MPMMGNLTQGPLAYIGMGSNLGDRALHLLLGVRGLACAGFRVTNLSSVYETSPVDVEDAQPLYLNMVVEVACHPATTTPEQLMARLLRIEYAVGRRRTHRRGARTLDLDLLTYGDERRATDYLTLPHPRLHLRRFVLAPLVELAPHARHPLIGSTYTELLNALDDEGAVVKLRSHDDTSEATWS